MGLESEDVGRRAQLPRQVGPNQQKKVRFEGEIKPLR